MNEFDAAARRLAMTNKAVDLDACIKDNMDYDALTSLASQVSVRHHKALARKPLASDLEDALRGRIARAQKRAEQDNKKCTENEEGRNVESCSEIATRFRVSGYQVARRLVELFCGSKKSFSEMMEDDFQESMDGTLYAELLVCMSEDPYNSQPCNQMQECIGNEFEEYLVDRLRGMDLCFETEAELRLRGKPRTPDILFSIPVALPPCEETYNRVAVVNWIDSKAMYADEGTFTEHIEQLQGYINRYGRGMVIYWRGFSESVKQCPAFRSTNHMVVLFQDVPSDWILPTTRQAPNGEM